MRVRFRHKQKFTAFIQHKWQESPGYEAITKQTFRFHNPSPTQRCDPNSINHMASGVIGRPRTRFPIISQPRNIHSLASCGPEDAICDHKERGDVLPLEKRMVVEQTFHSSSSTAAIPASSYGVKRMRPINKSQMLYFLMIKAKGETYK